MRIIEVKSYLKKLQLTKPYTIAYNTFSDVELVFLEIILENGIVGIGSASPAEEVIGENSQQTYQNLQSEFVQNFVGRDIRHFQQLIYEAHLEFPLLAATQAAIDIALHDAFCKFIDVSVVEFYGQKISSLPTSVTVGIMDVNETIEEAQNFEKLGFKILKIKTGLNVDTDIERIVKLREIFKNRLKIRVDANQGYSVQDLLKFYNSTKNLDIELIEQPILVGKETELEGLDESLRQILTGDESLKNAKYAIEFASKKPFGIYNIKLMKCGGIIGAKEIATVAHNSNINLFWGCNDESIVSITAALHVAYSCQNTKFIDLDGSFDLAEDLVTGGFRVEDGYMKIYHKAGFGFEKI